MKDTQMISPRIDKEDHKKAKIFCIKKGITLQEFINEAIKEKLEKEK